VEVICPLRQASCVEGNCALWVLDGCAFYWMAMHYRAEIEAKIEAEGE